MDSKTLLVTGASRGIGAQTALLAAQSGWRVAVNFHSNSLAADAVVRQIRDAGGSAISIQADIGVESDIEKMFAHLDAKWGPIEGLVNNAGIVDFSQRVDQFSAERLERMMRINVIGPFLCAKEAVLRMSTRHGGPGGVIVNVGSAASRLGSPNQYVDYAASKGAIDVMTVGLAKEVASEGIRVNAVRPGVIDTEIHASGGLPHRARDVASQMPMGRAGTSEEVANAIVWLLSPSATYCSGSILDIAGAR
ncbi:MAG: SDR family oxidoreductase [Betaproteobacteria bacterium]